MCSRCSSLFAVLTISWLMRASSYTNSFNNSLLDQPTKTCSNDGIPVCGSRDKQLVLFPNECLLNEVNNKDVLQDETFYRKTLLQHCMPDCKVSCSEKHQLVCARNLKTNKKRLFRNQCDLTEYVCKTNIEYMKISLSNCLSKKILKNIKVLKKRSYKENTRRPIPCTSVFKPVCGIYMGVKSSFKNECLLNAENIVYNRDWRIFNHGMCPQDYSKTRRHKEKSTQNHFLKKRSHENNFYNVDEKKHTYNTINFLNHENQMNISPNDGYVYTPQTFHPQLISHETSGHQYPVPLHEDYDEILNRIVTIPAAGGIEHSKNRIEEPVLFKSDLKSPLFAINRMNPNYMTNGNSAHRQSIRPSINSLIGQSQKEYYYQLEKFDPRMIIEDISDVPTTTFFSINTTPVPQTIDLTTNNPEIFNIQQHLKGKDVKCKFGSHAVCAVLANGTTQTFESICDMMTANVYLKYSWAKLHDGICEDCKNNCSRDYSPVCVSRNGVNYTMVNQCYYNMAICMDKKSKWQVVQNGECKRYSRITDKFANSKPGFSYTSSYFAAETTATPSSEALKVTSKLYSKSKKHKPNSKRAIALSQQSRTHRCCPGVKNTSQISQDNIECECLSDSTLETSTTLSLHPTQTESHIMRLVKSKDKNK